VTAPLTETISADSFFLICNKYELPWG